MAFNTKPWQTDVLPKIQTKIKKLGLKNSQESKMNFYFKISWFFFSWTLASAAAKTTQLYFHNPAAWSSVQTKEKAAKCFNVCRRRSIPDCRHFIGQRRLGRIVRLRRQKHLKVATSTQFPGSRPTRGRDSVKAIRICSKVVIKSDHKTGNR